MNDAAAKKDDVVMGAMEKGDGPRAACRGGRGVRGGTHIAVVGVRRATSVTPSPGGGPPYLMVPLHGHSFRKIEKSVFVIVTSGGVRINNSPFALHLPTCHLNAPGAAWTRSPAALTAGSASMLINELECTSFEEPGITSSRHVNAADIR